LNPIESKDDSKEACKAFFENADVETNRAIIEKLWEADPENLIKAVVEHLGDDVIVIEKYKVKITSGKSIQATRHMIRSST
jgi:LPS sulfotransferase NodH